MKFTDKEREQVEVIQARVLANYGRKVTEREAVTIGLTMAADCFMNPQVRIIDLALVRQFMTGDEFAKFTEGLNHLADMMTGKALEEQQATQGESVRTSLH